MNHNPPLPVLYSFRRCPYAIRARHAIAFAQQKVELREVVLKEKPLSMVTISSKGTVPVLLLADGAVIDESRKIMTWALQLNDPTELLPAKKLESDTELLLDENDFEFKFWLDRYKYADRYPAHSAHFYRSRAESFLEKLESRLQINPYFFGSQPTLADIAIMPFVRQFSLVDSIWFDQSVYVNVQRWLKSWIESEPFQSVMTKYPQWCDDDGQLPILFPEST